MTWPFRIEAPEDMRAAAQEEFTLVEGLVREAAQAKGDARVVAASDFFVFNVQRREKFDETDDAKGDRDGLFDGPLVAPTLETYEDAKARMDAGVKGYYSQNYGSGERSSPQSAQRSAQGGYRGRGRSSRTFRGRSESGFAGYPDRGGRGGSVRARGGWPFPAASSVRRGRGSSAGAARRSSD